MRIAFVTMELPYPCNSGGRIYTWNRIKELHDLGNEIELFTFIDENEYIDETKIGEYCHRIRTYRRNKNVIYNFKNIFKPYCAISRYSEKLKADLSNDEFIDIIVIDAPQLLYNVPKRKIPIVLSQHNIEYLTFRDIAKKSKNIFKKIMFYIESIRLYMMERKEYSNSRIKLFTFISSEDMKKFQVIFGNKNSLLVPFGYTTVEKKCTNNKNKKIVFTGKMNYQPNVDSVLWFSKEVYPLIRNKINNVEFYIVGKNPTESILKLNGNGIIVTGLVESVNEYLDNADLVVIPLLSGGGVKIKLIEALGRENIVVSTNKGVEGTKFKNGKHLIIADNKQDFADACIKVLENLSEYNKLGKEAKNLIDNEYSWKKICTVYERKIKEILI